MFNLLRRTILIAGLVFPGLLALGAVHADVIDGESLIDPTRPVNFSGVVTADNEVLDMIRNVISSSYEVSFVRVGSSSSIAVVNDQRVSIGDIVGGATVSNIDRSGVTLLVNGQERRVELYGSSIKTPVAER